MKLRELMIERILFCMGEEGLWNEFKVKEEELHTLSDLDFLELYEECTWEIGNEN